MKKRLLNSVKYFNYLYKIYFVMGTWILAILKIFIKPNDRLILFVSFGGLKYDDSPKEIYLAMKDDPKFKNYRLVWAFREPDKYPLIEDKVKIDTYKYFSLALKSRCWITNSSIQRGLNFKGKKTFYLNTWHGTPIKKMGEDISKENKSFKIKSKSDIDLMLAQSQYEIDIFSRVFNIDADKFKLIGLPRNDILFNVTDNLIHETKLKIGLPLDKKIILYAPTFREFSRDTSLNCVYNNTLDFDLWDKKLSEEYIVILRLHYEMKSEFNIEKYNGFLYDFSEYPSLNELMIVSDILISDYSSIFVDFSILERPMIAYAYDYDMYNAHRGCYFDIREKVINASESQSDLLDLIPNIDGDENKITQFKNKFINAGGNSTTQVLKILHEELNNN